MNRASFLRSVAGLEDVIDEACGSDVRRRTGTRIIRQSRDDKRYEIFCLAENLVPLFGQVWLLTAGPLIGVSVVFAELSKNPIVHTLLKKQLILHTTFLRLFAGRPST